MKPRCLSAVVFTERGGLALAEGLPKGGPMYLHTCVPPALCWSCRGWTSSFCDYTDRALWFFAVLKHTESVL